MNFSFVPNSLFVTIVPLALLTSTAYSRRAEFGRYLAYENSLKLARRVLFHVNVSLCCLDSFDSPLFSMFEALNEAPFCALLHDYVLHWR